MPLRARTGPWPPIGHHWLSNIYSVSTMCHVLYYIYNVVSLALQVPQDCFTNKVCKSWLILQIGNGLNTDHYMCLGLALSVHREVRFYEPVTTAWRMAKGRHLYGIMVTSFCNRGSSYQRRCGGSQAAPKSSAVPWAPTAVLRWEGYDKGHRETPQPGIIGSSIGDRYVVSPSLGI